MLMYMITCARASICIAHIQAHRYTPYLVCMYIYLCIHLHIALFIVVVCRTCFVISGFGFGPTAGASQTGVGCLGGLGGGLTTGQSAADATAAAIAQQNQQQLLQLTSSPYGDSPLFHNLRQVMSSSCMLSLLPACKWCMYTTAFLNFICFNDLCSPITRDYLFWQRQTCIAGLLLVANLFFEVYQFHKYELIGTKF